MIKLEKLSNIVNTMVNKQEIKFFIKKNGHWDEASRHDTLFLHKKDFVKEWPRKRGDLLQTNSWEGYLLAIFIGNVNNKDIRYIISKLSEAERLAPNWVRENSNME